MKPTPFETHGALKVTGHQLTDLQGNVVQLRGLSTHNLSLYPEYVNEAFLLQARDEWNVSLIRLAMYTAEDGGYCVEDDANRERLKGYIKEGVALAKKLGLYVIVDWHILFDNNPLINLDQAKHFWDEMSVCFKDEKHVLYEICNEPNGDITWDDVTSYAKEIIPIIRKNDPDKIIIVGTLTWSQRLDLAVKDPITITDNLMYALHFYADTHREKLRKIYTEAFAEKLPIFVTEFGGVCADGNGDLNEEQSNTWLDLLNKNETSYCIWNLSNKDETSAFFIPACTKVSGFEKEDLRKQAIWYIERLKA